MSSVLLFTQAEALGDANKVSFHHLGEVVYELNLALYLG